MKILYEDNHLIAVEKPVNIPVQEDASGDKDLFTMVKEDIKERYQKPGNVYLGLIHRLDRPVGGVIVFAKTSKAASRMSDLIRRQDLEKHYTAVVRGVPEPPQGRKTDYLYKDRQKNQVYAVDKSHEEAKKAVLDYRLAGTSGGLSLVQIQLETGRSHQIRVQMAELGVPLYGDQKYGSRVNKPGEQIALWSTEMGFTHPVKKEWVSITSRPPDEDPWNIFYDAGMLHR
ncbi:RluA family pseudouridine synthase [Alkalicoccus urumqiensis]|uniref:RNA pseudouridylate synthase n=1 Tax=Alkalicoccus urumqiensis TaxID=1548213 RepID=A0A2P6MJ22_ALKUR|nr:RluA family pseudouridine synthase [Alkalicoccus urumqiensis]PRO66288.1 RNA pseudouridine synthase [Alkalicoccus urumqiensis]